MKKHELIVFVVRTAGRPLFREFEKNVRRNWAESAARLVVFYHGNNLAVQRELAELAIAREVHVEPVTVAAPNTTWNPEAKRYTIANAVSYVAGLAESWGYPYFGVMDDDADFPRPEETMQFVVEQFKRERRLGALGPWSGFLAWRKLGSKQQGVYKDAVEIAGPPWATFGCQFYRTAAFADSVDLIRLRRLWGRADIYCFVSLYARSWKLRAIRMPFTHKCSNLTMGGDALKGLRWRLAQTEVSYDIIIADAPVALKVKLQDVRNREMRKWKKKILELMKGGKQ